MRTRLIVLLATVVTLAPPLLDTVGADTVDTGKTAPPELAWWGPTDDDEGWHLRIPVTVESGMQGPVDNLPAVGEIDLGNVTKQAGWLTTSVAGREVLESFTLDPSSIRVVEYTNFQLPRVRSTDAHMIENAPQLAEPAKHTIPVQIVKGFWDTQQSGPFHPTANPSVTLRWIMPGTTAPDETRHFMVYFEIEENGGAPGQDPERVEGSGIGGLDWIGRGTSVAGVGSEVVITALHDETHVRVYQYQGRTPTPMQEGEATLAAGQSGSQRFSIQSQPKPWLVKADGPVVASSHVPWGREPPPYTHETGFMPSLDGTLLGMDWSMPMGATAIIVYNPGDRPVSVRVGDRSEFVPSGGAVSFGGQTGTLDVEASGPVLVQGRTQEAELYPFVSGTGAPTGKRMFGTVEGARMVVEGNVGTRRHQPDAYSLRATNLADDKALVRLETLGENRQVLPQPGPATERPGEPVRPWPEWLTHKPSDDAVGPLQLTVLDPENPTRPLEDPSVVGVGGPTRPVTGVSGPVHVASPIGGIDARNFSAPGPVHVIAWHDGTEVRVSPADSDPKAFALDRHQHRFIESGGAVRITASKPVAVLPDGRLSYGAGHLEAKHVAVGPAQYRGPLLSLSPTDGEEPMVDSISFGANATFELTVENRGRAVDGSAIADEAIASLPATPPGWNATVEPKRLKLPPDGTADLTVRVQAPETRGSGDRLVLPVRLSSATNPNMTDEMTTITLLREQRSVGLWFEQEDGPRELTLRFQPGQDREVPVVVKNTGSAKDTFRLNVANVEAGWGTVFTDDEGQTVRTVELDSGQERTLNLDVTPPAPGSVPIPASLSLTATSTNDTTVSDKALLDGLVATESNLRFTTDTPLVVVRPGEEVTIPLRLHNDGETAQDVQLNATGDLPSGWSDPAFLFRGDSLAPVGNRLNSVSPTGADGVPLELHLEVPEDAEGGAATSLMVEARAVGLGGGEPDRLPVNVHVDPFVEITHDPLAAVTVPPGQSRERVIGIANEGNVEARLTAQPVSVPSGLQVELPRNLTLAPRGNATLTAKMAAPPGAPAGQEMLEVLLVDASGAATLVELPVRVPEGPQLTADDLGQKRIVAGAVTNLTLRAENTGNAPSNATLETNAPADWIVRPHPDALELSSRGSATIRLEVVPPAGAQAGANIEILAREPDGTELLASLNITPVIADIAIESAGTLKEDTGDAIAAQGTLVNRANVTLRNLTVALTGGGEILSTTTLDRVPADDSRTVVVTASSDGPPGQLRLVADPGEQIPETDRSDNTAPIDAPGEKANAPMPTWLPLAAILGALATTRLNLCRTNGP